MNRNFVEFFECLVQREVRFLVVGGYALAAHGHPRYTKDLDVWIWMDPENASALLDALADFGFGSVGLTADDFIVPNAVVQLGYPPQRIDLLTTPDGVRFEDCWPRRVTTVLDGIKVPFIGLDDLIANKVASDRDQDRVDVTTLRRTRKSRP